MKSSTRTVAVGLVAVAIQALMVLAFAWPSARLEPRHLPLVVAGPAAATTPVARRLEAEHPGAFDLRRVPDQSAARRALADREAYGAIVVTPAGPQVLVASAASPAVAQLLAQMGQRMSGRPLPTVQDVVAADRDDPRGAAFSALALPLVISGLAAGILLMFAVPGAGRRLAGLLIFAVGAGLTSAAIVHGWLSVLSGSYLAVAGVIGLVSLAVAAPVAGLAAVLGRPGLGLGGLAMLLLANPLSGVTSAPELLPEPWGAIGQGMPAGAGGTLLRSVSFFDGARAGWPLTVLLIWAGAGLLLVAVGGLRDRSPGGPAGARGSARTGRMNTVEVRVARGAGDRAAAEIYFAGTLVDVSVATDIGANLLHGAWRLQADGGPRVAAWGQLPVGGSVTVTFAKGCWSRVAEVTVVADAFWLAEAEGDFRSVSVTAASGRVRGRLGRLS